MLRSSGKRGRLMTWERMGSNPARNNKWEPAEPSCSVQENLEKAEFLKEVLCIELNKLNLLLAEQVLLMISAMLVSRSWESKKSGISFFFKT